MGNAWVVKILSYLITQVVTDDMVKEAMKMFVDYLRELAKKSDNSLDDAVVEIVAKALGVD